MTAKTLLRYGLLLSLIAIPSILMGCGGVPGGPQTADDLTQGALANATGARLGAAEEEAGAVAPSRPQQVEDWQEDAALADGDDPDRCEATPMPLPGPDDTCEATPMPLPGPDDTCEATPMPLPDPELLSDDTCEATPMPLP